MQCDYIAQYVITEILGKTFNQSFVVFLPITPTGSEDGSVSSGFTIQKLSNRYSSTAESSDSEYCHKP
jgi:hypothetical protein